MPASIAILHRLECESVVNSFQSSGSTVAEMQEYADCVKYLHPDNINLSSGSILYIKFTIVLTIVAMIYAMYLASKDDYDKFSAFIFFTFCALFIVPVVMGVLAICYTGVLWVIS